MAVKGATHLQSHTYAKITSGNLKLQQRDSPDLHKISMLICQYTVLCKYDRINHKLRNVRIA